METIRKKKKWAQCSGYEILGAQPLWIHLHHSPGICGPEHCRRLTRSKEKSPTPEAKCFSAVDILVSSILKKRKTTILIFHFLT